MKSRISCWSASRPRGSLRHWQRRCEKRCAGQAKSEWPRKKSISSGSGKRFTTEARRRARLRSPIAHCSLLNECHAKQRRCEEVFGSFSSIGKVRFSLERRKKNDFFLRLFASSRDTKTDPVARK